MTSVKCAGAPAAVSASSQPIALSGRTALLLDTVERLIVVGLYIWMVSRMVAGIMAAAWRGNVLLLLGEGLVVFFVAIRRPTANISYSPFEWCLALAATSAPLMVVAGDKQNSWFPAFFTLVMLVGLLVQFAAKLTLARSFGLVPAHRGLKLSGPYRIVRHPMYAGYLIMQVGFLALNPTWWNCAAYIVAWTLQVRRLLAEEAFLGRDPAYREYQGRVTYRVVPGLF
jgi:protein-S-isoprenylcysteine O-methyltransferase Ste14